MSASRRAVIVGGGIGGLSAAIALHRAGWDPIVLERAREVKEVGAALAVAANGMHALRSLGVAEAVERAGAKPARGELRAPSGRVLNRARIDDLEARFGAPFMVVMRPALQSALLDALGRDRVRLGARVAGLSQDERGARVRLADGEVVEGDVVVGADGIRSVVRAVLRGPEPLRYAGFTAWRGVAEDATHLLPPEGGAAYVGRGNEFGMVPAGGGRVYWFATARAPPGGVDTPGEVKRNLHGHLGAFHAPVHALINLTPAERIRRDDIYDRDPITDWGRGRVTLLGDAAHPMTPSAGQGACQALEDAVALARHLGPAQEIEPALRAYEGERAPRANRVVAISRRNASATLLESRLACAARDFLLSLLPKSMMLRAYSGAI